MKFLTWSKSCVRSMFIHAAIDLLCVEETLQLCKMRGKYRYRFFSMVKVSKSMKLFRFSVGTPFLYLPDMRHFPLKIDIYLFSSNQNTRKISKWFRKYWLKRRINLNALTQSFSIKLQILPIPGTCWSRHLDVELFQML